jgi:carbamoyltransferase
MATRDKIHWGVSAGFHDASISVVQGDQILFAGHSERYSKKKNDKLIDIGLINNAMHYGEPDVIHWYENPYKKALRRLIAGQSNIWNSPRSFLRQAPQVPIKIGDHHESHASAGYYTSGYDESAVLVIDAIGEFTTVSISHYKAETDTRRNRPLYRTTYPRSLGLFYSAITDAVGLKPNEDEYILMGMAAYGKPYLTAYEENLKLLKSDEMAEFVDNLHIGLHYDYFAGTGLTEFDIAAGAQAVTEQILNKLVSKWCGLGENLVFMGGVALNCVANSKMRSRVKDMWIMPNPGDCGSSLGAAALQYGKRLNWQGPYLGHDMGGEYPVDAILGELMTNKIVGVATGRAEFGPRALGTRSLLADPRGADIKDRVNEIKRRQKFRPFAPMVLEEHAEEIFNMMQEKNPYMQGTYSCLYENEYPAIVHADKTSRVQTVGKQDHPGVRALLEKWYFMTGCPMLLNTSLNIKGEPMVNNRADADRFEQRYGVKVCS